MKMKDMFPFFLSDLFLNMKTIETSGSEEHTENLQKPLRMLIFDRLKVCKISAVLKILRSNQKKSLLKPFYRAMACETPETEENDMA